MHNSVGQFQKFYIYVIRISELSERERMREKNIWNNNAYKIPKVGGKHTYIDSRGSTNLNTH